MEIETTVKGAGLGLRRSLLKTLIQDVPPAVDFFEIAPENWITIGGRMGRQLREIRQHTPIICHGLSLSIGGVAPLDRELILNIKEFLNELEVPIYSEHLSYTTDDAQLYDLLPLPFTEETIKHVSARIRQVQDMLERRIAIENISYYLVPQIAMNEAEFINAVMSEADCDLLLDVNNVYVNSQNHQYDANAFLQALKPKKVAYIHVAGHFVEPDGLTIDTHGADVIHPVWQLLTQAYQLFGNLPTLLERDFNLPEMSDLVAELTHIKESQSLYYARQDQSAA